MTPIGDAWEARITRSGRWIWHIDPVKGMIGLNEGYLAFGSRERAEQKARRIIARLQRRDDQISAAYTITRNTP